MRLDKLPPILAPLTLKCIMCFAQRVLLELKQLSEHVDREVTFGIFGRIDDGRREGLLGRLALENLLFDGAVGYEAVNEAFLLLPVTPDTGEGLLISSRIPV